MACACEEEAGVDGFVDKEKPEKEPELPDVAATFVTPNPVKELTAAELAVAADEAVAEEDEELKLKAGNAGVEAVVVLAAGVEAVVVVTVENNGADDVPKDKEVGFDTAEPDNVGAGVDDEAALPNPYAAAAKEGAVVEVDAGVELAVLFKNGELPPKENPVEEAELDDDKLGKDGVVAVAVEGREKEKPEELDEEEAAVKEGAVVKVAVVVELSVLFPKDEPPRKENPVEDEKGEVVVEFEAELEDMKLEKDGAGAAAEDEDEEPKELEVAGAGEDENKVEPLLAPNGEDDDPTFSEKQKLKKGNVKNTDAGDDDEAGLPNPKEEDGAKEKPEVLEEVEAAAVEAAVVFELALLEENGEPTEKENPAAPKGDVVAEFEAELDENKPENDGVVTVVAVEADEDEDAKLKGPVADEDENGEEPLLAPNRDEDVPNPPEKYKFNPKTICNNLLV
ncbi:hypothetical protein GOBAR_DD29161 [Gossypium barbadense]|nr:hypothetical protein GOBAR_DD29161 [Gossypium barbadense]